MRKKEQPTIWGIAVVLLLTLAAFACTPAAAPTPAPTKPPGAAAATPTPAAPKTVVATPTLAPPKPAAAPPTAPPKPATVRFGSPGAVTDAGVFIALEKGYFKELGLDVQILTFQSAALVIAPLGSGELEVGGGAFSTGLLNAIDRGVQLKVVATKGAAVPGFDSSWVTVRKDLIDSGQVKEPKDLKGRKIGVSSEKSSAEAQIHFVLKPAGLTIKDVGIVALSFADMVAAYGNKALDAASMAEPFISTSVEKGLAVRWPPGATSAIYGGEYQIAGLYFSEQFGKNLDVARRFVVGYVKGLRDYNDAFAKGKNKSEIISILTKYSSEKDPAVYEKMQMSYLNPDGKLNVRTVKMEIDYFKEMGYYTGKLEPESIIDTKFIDYAVQQLGPYK